GHSRTRSSSSSAATSRSRALIASPARSPTASDRGSSRFTERSATRSTCPRSPGRPARRRRPSSSGSRAEDLQRNLLLLPAPARRRCFVDHCADEIVVTRLRDPDATDLSAFDLATREVDLAVDLRRLARVPAHHHEIVLFARSLDEDVELSADEAAVLLPRDL